MKFIGIISTRYGSSRFPGKPLAMLGGKTVIQQVYEQASQVLEDTFVATNDQRIFDAVTTFDGKAVVISVNHQSGTDRIKEATEQLGLTCDVVLNIQGGEPFTQRQQIETLCYYFDSSKTQIATLGKRFESQEALKNPSSSRIMVDKDGYVLYFSRSVIPFIRNKKGDEWVSQYPFSKHLDIYAYHKEVLKKTAHLPQSSSGLAGSLEQLGWLQDGYRIKVGPTDIETVGMDTPEDLERTERFLDHFQQMG